MRSPVGRRRSASNGVLAHERTVGHLAQVGHQVKQLLAAHTGVEIEVARQHFRALAERAEKNGDATTLKLRQENLESAIKLARMDLTELQGLPLPAQ